MSLRQTVLSWCSLSVPKVHEFVCFRLFLLLLLRLFLLLLGLLKLLLQERLQAVHRAELGEGVVVMNVKPVKPKGLFAFLKTPMMEVTVAESDTRPAPSA